MELRNLEVKQLPVSLTDIRKKCSQKYENTVTIRKCIEKQLLSKIIHNKTTLNTSVVFYVCILTLGFSKQLQDGIIFTF